MFGLSINSAAWMFGCLLEVDALSLAYLDERLDLLHVSYPVYLGICACPAAISNHAISMMEAYVVWPDTVTHKGL